MAKKRKQLYRAKRYRQDKAIEKRRNDPNYKPVTFWEAVRLSEQLEQSQRELITMFHREQFKKLEKELGVI